MKLTVLGTGYVGLVAGACFSDSGNHVTCVDLNKDKIDRLNKGEIPIYEPGLEELVARNSRGKRLSFTTDFAGSIGNADVIFIAVGTPSGDDGALDLKYVIEAAKMIRDNLKEEALVVLKSTVPVGTADKVREVLKDCKVKAEVVSNPEFLKEGTAVGDFLRPERVIIGARTEEARRTMGDLYAPFIRSGNPILFMDNRSAELAKYAANAFLAMKISYINDMANLAEKVGADIHDVRRAIVTDSRIGNKFLYPGCGYGGSCFPKDVLGLIHLGNENDLPLDIFKAVHNVNERQKTVLFDKMQRFFKGGMKGKRVAIWGLSFKPETDDVREAPSLKLISLLLKEGVQVRAYDPVAGGEVKRLFEGQVEICQDAYETIHKTDALVILTEWNEFRTPDFKTMKRELNRPVVFDGRNLYNPESMAKLGFTYYCIGKQDPA